MKIRLICLSLLISSAYSLAQKNDGAIYSINFKTPSGNIICGGDIKKNSYGVKPWNGVSCLVGINNKPIKQKPKDCDLDWGGMFSLPEKGETKMECYSDFPFKPDAQILHYGKKIQGNGWQCTSQPTGLYCNNNTNNGFKINRNQQALF